MTVAIWRGPGGTSSHPKSGDFAVASNWSGGVVPDSGTHVIMAAGKYAVSYDSGAATLGSIDIGVGVTLTVSEPTESPVYVELKGDSSNAGRLAIAGSTLFLDNGSTLVNLGEIYGADGYYPPSIQSDGKIINDGLVAASSGDDHASLYIATTLENESDGVVNSRGGGDVIFSGTVDNAGLLSAIDGGTVSVGNEEDPGNTINLGEGVLTGGHWSAIGDHSTLNLYNSEISTLAGGAVVTLSGAGSTVSGEDASGVTQIETSLTQIDAGAELHILGGRDYATGQDVDVSGLLELGGGAFTAHLLTVHDNSGSELRGFGRVAADMDVYGVLRADNNKAGQTLDLTGANRILGSVLGTGVLEIGGGVSRFEDGSRVLVKGLLVDGGGELQLGHNLGFKGKFGLDTGGIVNLDGYALNLSGKVTLADGQIGGGALLLQGAQVSVSSLVTVDADVRNNGSITLKGGVLQQDGAVTGSGAFHIGGQSQLTFAGAVSSGQTVYMDGAQAHLDLSGGDTFKGTVAKFAFGDTLDFNDIAASGAKLTWKGDDTGGRLTVADGSHQVSVHLEGDYRRSNFHLGNDGSGHAEVTYGSAPATTIDHDAAHWDAHGGWAI